MPWCNAYGAENKGGQGTVFGGLLTNAITTQPVCKQSAAHRFRWICEHGHRGPIVGLCEWHYAEFTGRRRGYSEQLGAEVTVPWNSRRDVQACPRCAAEAPECQDPDHQAMMRGRPGRCGCRQHKCNVELVTVS